MHHIADQWRLELDWAKSLREKELTQAEGVKAPMASQSSNQSPMQLYKEGNL
jgi:hypothetical protein